MWDVNVDFAAWFEIGGGKFGWLVVAFRAPSDVVGIAEGIDVEDVDVGWRQEEVLNERGDQMPRIEEEYRGNNPEDVGGEEGDDQSDKESILG